MGAWGETFSENDEYQDEMFVIGELIENRFVELCGEVSDDHPEDYAMTPRMVFVGIMRMFDAADYLASSDEFKAAVNHVIEVSKKHMASELEALDADEEHIEIAKKELADAIETFRGMTD
jgi:hypothetical protein